MKDLFSEIERCLPEGGDWCPLEKAQALAALVIALRPTRILEVGVWMGGSLVPMLLALKKNGAGHAVAIDPWSVAASVVDEQPANVAWWGTVDHEAAFRTFSQRLDKHGLRPFCEIVRLRSDDVKLPDGVLDLVHIDGSHTMQAFRDVEHFAPLIREGGILVMDDVNWEGSGVAKAVELAKTMDFAELYPLSSGSDPRGCLVMQRVRGGL